MTVFTVLGLTIVIFIVFIIISILFNICCGIEIEKPIGFILVLACISILVAIFITKPQKFGYEKITILENSI